MSNFATSSAAVDVLTVQGFDLSAFRPFCLNIQIHAIPRHFLRKKKKGPTSDVR
jgi:hypothetical protein